MASHPSASSSARPDDAARPVGTLRARRAEPDARAFDPGFDARSPHFWPIVPAARLFADATSWPEVATYGRVLTSEAKVSFEESIPPPRRRRRDGAPIDPKRLYDGRIALEGRVPTRPTSWHDFLNALVWGTFPRAKWELHARQHRALAEHVPAGATRVPGARTRELDALALLDEGGVIVLARAGEVHLEAAAPPRVKGDTSRASAEIARTAALAAALAEDRARGMIFGHALYEGLVLDTRAMAARAFVVLVTELPTTNLDAVAVADEALARALATEALTPELFPRLPLAALPARGSF